MLIYEINAWVWLGELGCDLGSVPPQEWDAIAGLGFDAVWLMGVWERSPAGVAIALRDDGLRAAFDRALPGWSEADVAGSPYCIGDYRVDERLGGPEGLARARAELAARGLRLLLDFVPNHLAPDHPWVAAHPERFVHGTPDDLAREPGGYLEAGGHVLANGRDPYLPPWPDVVQLDLFAPGTRAAARETLLEIAAQCDGVRCDLAMLAMSDVFARTWGREPPGEEYWPPLIAAVKRAHPAFTFVAEAYWDLEHALQQQGFDHCYDKRLYDRLREGDAAAVRAHLAADPGYQRGLVRFLENHDEPRAAAVLPGARGRAAAVATLTQSGARLVHEGQLDGRRTQLPVFLARRPHEARDEALRAFYARLLRAAAHDGAWQLAETSGWDDSRESLVAWGRQGDPAQLVVVNLSGEPASGHAAWRWGALRGRTWTLEDALTGEAIERRGDDLHDGLYVALGPWQAHVFTAL